MIILFVRAFYDLEVKACERALGSGSESALADIYINDNDMRIELLKSGLFPANLLTKDMVVDIVILRSRGNLFK